MLPLQVTNICTTTKRLHYAFDPDLNIANQQLGLETNQPHLNQFIFYLVIGAVVH